MCDFQGDPNVPAGEITVKVDLSCALNLTEDDQDTPSVWTPNSASPRRMTSHCAVSTVQPFRLPAGYVERAVDGVPTICRARSVQFGHFASLVTLTFSNSLLVDLQSSTCRSDARSGRYQVVTSWMGDSLRTGKPFRCITTHPGQLSLPSLRGK